MRKFLGIVVLVVICMDAHSLIRPLPSAYWDWEELSDVRSYHGGNWTYVSRQLEGDESLQVGSGGGSNDYCQLIVEQGRTTVLRFGANTDVVFGKPRMWMEPGPNRRFLTYHCYLRNGQIGEDLPEGYWLWTWDGTRYQPTRADVSLLKRWVQCPIVFVL